MPQVTGNVGRGYADKVIKAEMRFRVNTLKSYGLPPISVQYAARCFAVNMDDLGFGNIGNGVVLLECPLGPGQVFQPGQGLVVRMCFPDRSANHSVGIVAERMALARSRFLLIPPGKILLL